MAEEACGYRALIQTEGTCWLNSILNMFLLSSNVFEDMKKLYTDMDVNPFTDEQLEAALTEDTCPLLTAEDSIKLYIFAHIHHAIKLQTQSIKPLQPKEVAIELARKITTNINTGIKVNDVIKPIREALHISKLKQQKIFYKITRAPLQHYYILEAAVIQFNITEEMSHGITYFRCNDNYYIFDSNFNTIYHVNFNLIEKNWKTKFISVYTKLYKQLYKNPEFRIDNLTVSLRLYRRYDNADNIALSNIYSIGKYLQNKIDHLSEANLVLKEEDYPEEFTNTISEVIINVKEVKNKLEQAIAPYMLRT